MFDKQCFTELLLGVDAALEAILVDILTSAACLRAQTNVFGVGLPKPIWRVYEIINIYSNIPIR